MRIGLAALLSVGLTAPVSTAGAQQPPAQFGVRGEVERPMASLSELDPTTSATTVRTTDRPRTFERLDELLLEAPGARVRRTGATGAFSSVSLRGGEAEHTVVVLDELPLVAPDGSAIDLSSIPPWLFERIEVYRGGAPAWLSGGGLMGVLRLVLPDLDDQHAGDRRVEVVAGAGSFGLYRARASVRAGSRDVLAIASASVTRAQNDYPYRDDGGTAFDPSDDRERTRQNAETLDVSTHSLVDVRLGAHRLRTFAAYWGREWGLAPPPARYVPDATGHRSQRRWLGQSALTLVDGRHRHQLAVGAGLESRRVADPDAQFGLLPRDTDDLLARGQLRFASELRLSDEVFVRAIGAYVVEGIAPSDRLARQPIDGSTRHGLAATVEGELRTAIDTTRVVVRPSGRLEWLGAQLHDPRGEGAARRTDDVLPTLRLGAALEPVRGLAFSTSVARTTRAPSFVELFGDRAFLVGNLMLRPEAAEHIDVGATYAGVAGALRGTFELRGFVALSHDLIRYQRTDQNQAVARNIGDARSLGVELSTSFELPGAFRVTFAGTYLDARDTTLGTLLPMRPEWTAYGRVESMSTSVPIFDRASGFVDLEYVGASFADPANLVVIPDRARIGVGASLELLAAHVRLDLGLRDLFDARGFDVLGLPLPGRSFYVDLTLVGD